MAWMEQQNLDLNTKLKLLAIVFRIPINYVSLVERSENSLITVYQAPVFKCVIKGWSLFQVAPVYTILYNIWGTQPFLRGIELGPF